jgi:hypothetical protein
MLIILLVGGLEHVLFFRILGNIIPSDIFQRGRSTTNQFSITSFPKGFGSYISILKRTNGCSGPKYFVSEGRQLFLG